LSEKKKKTKKRKKERKKERKKLTRRRNQPINHPKLPRRLVDVKLPIVPPLRDVRADELGQPVDDAPLARGVVPEVHGEVVDREADEGRFVGSRGGGGGLAADEDAVGRERDEVYDYVEGG